MSALLEIRNLRVRRDNRLVLVIDQLSIERNKVLALVGPNGAGKSTLLLVLAGLLKPEKGEILMNGKLREYIRSHEYRRHIGMVMQEPLLLNMSVAHNVAIGLRFRHLPESETSCRVDEWLERLKIFHLKNRPAVKLSGGETQRVALARALVLQPDLLLLDEPFNSLDKKTHTELIHDLKSLLPKSGATTVFCTHDDREVELLADTKIELVDGTYQSQKKE